jgi:serine phosphatase RsbU (regulator of sigma subunit)
MRELPFVIGRAPESQLVFTQEFVSRHHAEITLEEGNFVIRDLGSRHGIYLDGSRVDEHILRAGDVIRFGSADGPEIQFGTDSNGTRLYSPSRDLLGKLQELQSEKSDLERLHWLIEAARELNSAGAVDRVIASLLQATIRLARVERGFVFLADAAGSMELASGIDASGNELQDSSTISRTVIRQAIEGTAQFLITDTLTAEGVALPESLVAQQIRAVICIPLRQHRQRDRRGERPALLGVLYLDSHYEPTQFTSVDHELLKTIAREAASLVENAQLAAVEESAKKQAEELQFAARIQQAVMAPQIPRPDFAQVQAESVACTEVGGDFFDVLLSEDTLSVAIVDVSGKGASAAILASVLQGMLYVLLEAGRPLAGIASSLNEYLCKKAVGKYATMVLVRLCRDGKLDFINCGHVRPRMCAEGNVTTIEQANVPVGLFANAEFESGTLQLGPGACVLLVSDGLTEAEDPNGEFFGEERLDEATRCADVPAILDLLQSFCCGTPATDDRTLVRLQYLA